MLADRMEFSWDQTKLNWLLRIVTGEEVIRRHCKAPKDADEQALRSVATKTIQEEGYEPEVADLSIGRQVCPVGFNVAPPGIYPRLPGGGIRRICEAGLKFTLSLEEVVCHSPLSPHLNFFCFHTLTNYPFCANTLFG